MAQEVETVRANLADVVDSDGPMGPVEGGDACTESMKHLAEIVTGIVVTKVFADGPDVLAWYAMPTNETDPMPVANWCDIERGKIDRIRVRFDLRPLVG